MIIAIELERQSFRWSWASTRVDGSFLSLNSLMIEYFSYWKRKPIAKEEKAEFDENGGQHYANCGPIDFWMDSILNDRFQRLDDHLDTGYRHNYRNNDLNYEI